MSHMTVSCDQSPSVYALSAPCLSSFLPAPLPYAQSGSYVSGAPACRPGEDVFENACLVRMLVGKNVLHRVAEELEDAASVLGVGA